MHEVPAVTMDGVDHYLERRIENRPSLFRVEVSISSVEPLISANNAVTVLRSPSAVAETMVSAEVAMLAVLKRKLQAEL